MSIHGQTDRNLEQKREHKIRVCVHMKETEPLGRTKLHCQTIKASGYMDKKNQRKKKLLPLAHNASAYFRCQISK